MKATLINPNGQNPVIRDVYEYGTGVYGNLNDVINALGGTCEPVDGSSRHYKVTLYSSKDNCTYYLNYDLRKVKEGNTDTIEVKYTDKDGKEQIIYNYGVVKNGNVIGNIDFLAGLAGITDIQKKAKSIVVNVPHVVPKVVIAKKEFAGGIELHPIRDVKVTEDGTVWANMGDLAGSLGADLAPGIRITDDYLEWEIYHPDTMTWDRVGYYRKDLLPNNDRCPLVNVTDMVTKLGFKDKMININLKSESNFTNEI